MNRRMKSGLLFALFGLVSLFFLKERVEAAASGSYSVEAYITNEDDCGYPSGEDCEIGVGVFDSTREADAAAERVATVGVWGGIVRATPILYPSRRVVRVTRTFVPALP